MIKCKDLFSSLATLKTAYDKLNFNVYKDKIVVRAINDEALVFQQIFVAESDEEVVFAIPFETVLQLDSIGIEEFSVGSKLSFAQGTKKGSFAILPYFDVIISDNDFKELVSCKINVLSPLLGETKALIDKSNDSISLRSYRFIFTNDFKVVHTNGTNLVVHRFDIETSNEFEFFMPVYFADLLKMGKEDFTISHNEDKVKLVIDNKVFFLKVSTDKYVNYEGAMDLDDLVTFEIPSDDLYKTLSAFKDAKLFVTLNKECFEYRMVTNSSPTSEITDKVQMSEIKQYRNLNAKFSLSTVLNFFKHSYKMKINETRIMFYSDNITIVVMAIH
jgi:hypothetical protein